MTQHNLSYYRPNHSRVDNIAALFDFCKLWQFDCHHELKPGSCSHYHMTLCCARSCCHVSHQQLVVVERPPAWGSRGEQCGRDEVGGVPPRAVGGLPQGGLHHEGHGASLPPSTLTVRSVEWSIKHLVSTPSRRHSPWRSRCVSPALYTHSQICRMIHKTSCIHSLKEAFTMKVTVRLSCPLRSQSDL